MFARLFENLAQILIGRDVDFFIYYESRMLEVGCFLKMGTLLILSFQ